MPTMILFALIIGIFTVIQFIIDTYRNRTSEYLLIINSGIFIIAIIGLLAFGFKSPTLELSTYSIAHVYADLGMIGGTVFLYILQRYLKGKDRYYYPAAIIGFLLLFLSVLYFISPNFFTLLIVDSFAFFGQAHRHQYRSGSQGMDAGSCMDYIQLRSPAHDRWLSGHDL